MADRVPMQAMQDLLDAFNASDWQRFRALLADNMTYEETGTGRRVQGADEYVRLCQGWKEGFPDVKGTVRKTLAQGETVAQQIVWEGTHTGPLVGPAGTMLPSGRRTTTHATIWATFQDGKLREASHYLDLLALLQQIGALPQP